LTLYTANIAKDADDYSRPFAPPEPDMLSVLIHCDGRGEEEDVRYLNNKPMADLDFRDHA